MARSAPQIKKTAARPGIKRCFLIIVYGRCYPLHLSRRSTRSLLFPKWKNSANLAEKCSRITMSLSSRLFEPVQSFRTVRADTEPVQITAAQTELRISVIATCCGVILLHILRNIRHFFHSRPQPQGIRSTHVQPTRGGKTSYQQGRAAQSFPAGVLLSLHTWGRY